MKNFSYIIIVFVLTGMQIANFAFSHNDENFITGTGNHQLRSHEDADNCQHLSLHHSDCVVCSLFSGRVFLSTQTFVQTSLQNFSTIIFDSPSLSLLPFFTTNFSHRGPPSSL